MAAIVYIKQGDTLPALQVTVTSNGLPVDLSGTSSKTFRMRQAAATPGVWLVNRACDFTTDGTDGKIEIGLTALETAVAGDYYGEFVVQWTPEIQTVPTQDYIYIRIVPTV